MKYVTAILLTLAFLLAGCGGGEYQAPPKSNGRTPGSTTSTDGSGGGGTQPTGPSRTREFNSEASKAQDAWKTFAKDKSADNYAVCGAHIFNALRYRIEHERNGHDAGTLRGLRELNQLKADWAKSEGQLTSEQKTAYQSHADYKAAKEAYDQIQQ